MDEPYGVWTEIWILNLSLSFSGSQPSLVNTDYLVLWIFAFIFRCALTHAISLKVMFFAVILSCICLRGSIWFLIFPIILTIFILGSTFQIENWPCSIKLTTWSQTVPSLIPLARATSLILVLYSVKTWFFEHYIPLCSRKSFWKNSLISWIL